MPLASKNNFQWPANIRDAQGIACKAELVSAPEGLRWHTSIAIKFLSDETFYGVFSIRPMNESKKAIADCSDALREFTKRVKYDAPKH